MRGGFHYRVGDKIVYFRAKEDAVGHPGEITKFLDDERILVRFPEYPREPFTPDEWELYLNNYYPKSPGNPSGNRKKLANPEKKMNRPFPQIAYLGPEDKGTLYISRLLSKSKKNASKSKKSGSKSKKSGSK
jgi:hypothetical protein